MSRVSGLGTPKNGNQALPAEVEGPVAGMFDDVTDLRELITMCVGAGYCCTTVPNSLEFDSAHAVEVADAAWNRLQAILADSFRSNQ